MNKILKNIIFIFIGIVLYLLLNRYEQLQIDNNMYFFEGTCMNASNLPDSQHIQDIYKNGSNICHALPRRHDGPMYRPTDMTGKPLRFYTKTFRTNFKGILEKKRIPHTDSTNAISFAGPDVRIPKSSEARPGTYQLLSNFKYPDIDSAAAATEDVRVHKFELSVSYMNDAPVLLDVWRRAQEDEHNMSYVDLRGLEFNYYPGRSEGYASNKVLINGYVVRDEDPFDHTSMYYDDDVWRSTDTSKYMDLMLRTRGYLNYHINTEPNYLTKVYRYDALHIRGNQKNIQPFSSIEVHRRDTNTHIIIPIHPFYKIENPYINPRVRVLAGSGYREVPWKQNIADNELSSDHFYAGKLRYAKEYLKDGGINRLYKPIFTDNHTVLKIYSMINKYYIKYKNDLERRIPRPILSVSCHAQSINETATRSRVTNVVADDNIPDNDRVIKIHKVTDRNQAGTLTCTNCLVQGCYEAYSLFNSNGNRIISQDKDPSYNRPNDGHGKVILAQSKVNIPEYHIKEEYMEDHLNAILNVRDCEFTILYKRRHDEECEEVNDDAQGDYLQYGAGIVKTRESILSGGIYLFAVHDKVYAKHPYLHMHVKATIKSVRTDPVDDSIIYTVTWNYIDILAVEKYNDFDAPGVSASDEVFIPEWDLKKDDILSMDDDKLDFEDYNRNLQIMRMFGLTTLHPNIDDCIERIETNPYAAEFPDEPKKIKNNTDMYLKIEVIEYEIEIDARRRTSDIEGIWSYNRDDVHGDGSNWHKINGFGESQGELFFNGEEYKLKIFELDEDDPELNLLGDDRDNILDVDGTTVGYLRYGNNIFRDEANPHDNYTLKITPYIHEVPMLFFGQRQLGLTRLGGNGCTIPSDSRPTSIYRLYDLLVEELKNMPRGIKTVKVFDLDDYKDRAKNTETDDAVANYNSLTTYDRFPEFDFRSKSKGDKYADLAQSTSRNFYTMFQYERQTDYGPRLSNADIPLLKDYTNNTYPLHMFVNGCVNYGVPDTLANAIDDYNQDNTVEEDNEPGAGGTGRGQTRSAPNSTAAETGEPLTNRQRCDGSNELSDKISQYFDNEYYKNKCDECGSSFQPDDFGINVGLQGAMVAMAGLLRRGNKCL